MKGIIKSVTLLIILFICCTRLFAQSKAIPVFVSGSEGYKSFRIPAIVKAKNGDLLAFCEGRINGGSDFGNIKIVLKRSNDEGKTWSALQIVASNENLHAGNSAPVVDLTDPDSGFRREGYSCFTILVIPLKRNCESEKAIGMYCIKQALIME